MGIDGIHWKSCRNGEGSAPLSHEKPTAVCWKQPGHDCPPGRHWVFLRFRGSPTVPGLTGSLERCGAISMQRGLLGHLGSKSTYLDIAEGTVPTRASGGLSGAPLSATLKALLLTTWCAGAQGAPSRALLGEEASCWLTGQQHHCAPRGGGHSEAWAAWLGKSP